jgi:CRISPR-associated exonuclease Cas4
MEVTGTHIHYYFNCHRQLWLFANGVNMEQTSDTVYEGKLIHETSYERRSERYREVEIGPVKIDYLIISLKGYHPYRWKGYRA